MNILQRSCQTLPLNTTEIEVQAGDYSDNGTQTDIQDSFPEYRETSDCPGLKEFLKGVEDMVIKELIKNSRSHAFDGYEVNWVDHNETVRAAFDTPSKDCISI